jgi:hypothetical protein
MKHLEEGDSRYQFRLPLSREKDNQKIPAETQKLRQTARKKNKLENVMMKNPIQGFQLVCCH